MRMEKSSLSKISSSMSRFTGINIPFFLGGGGIIDNKIRFASRPKRCLSLFFFFQKSASVILRLLGTNPQTRPIIIIITKSLRKKKNNNLSFESGRT